MAEVKLLSDKFVVPICIPFNMEFNYSAVGKPDIWPSKFSQVSKMEVMLGKISFILTNYHAKNSFDIIKCFSCIEM